MAPFVLPGPDCELTDKRLQIIEGRKATQHGYAPPPVRPDPDWKRTATLAKRNIEAWNRTKRTSYNAPGTWEYTTEGKPTRKWVSGSPAPHRSPINYERALKDRDSGRKIKLEDIDFPADVEDRGISTTYHELWVGGDSQAFIESINNQLGYGNALDLPQVSIQKVWRCLVGQLVPEGHWEGTPSHLIAGPDNIWKIAKAIFFLITQGKYFCNINNVIKDEPEEQRRVTDGGDRQWLEYSNQTKKLALLVDRRSFDSFADRQLCARRKYSRTFMKMLLGCLEYYPEDRPTKEEILNFIKEVIPIIDGVYVTKDMRIPTGLRVQEGKIYEKTLQYLDETKGEVRPNIVVVSDLQRDVDDIVAWFILAEMHRLGLIVLKGFVVNLLPADLRARAGRGALDSLKLNHLPVGEGTAGSVLPEHVNRAVMPYEFDACPFMAPNTDRIEDGQKLLARLFRDSKWKGEKLTVLMISSLRDMAQFISGHEELVADVAEKFVMQGGFDVTDGVISPRADAANHKFDPPAADAVYKFAVDHRIPLRVYTKVATFGTFIPDEFCQDVAEDGHILGGYLRHAQLAMDSWFYECAWNDINERFAPIMGPEWYLKNKSTWFDVNHHEDEQFPVGDDVLPWLSKLAAYDALSAIATGGDGFMDALAVREPFDGERPFHQCYDAIPPNPATANNGVNMAQVIRAIGRGGLLANIQNLKKVAI